MEQETKRGRDECIAGSGESVDGYRERLETGETAGYMGIRQAV
jgi:hypothetical protein